MKDPMIPELLKIQRVRKENHDTFTLELEPHNGSGRFPFAPGQFNMLYVYGVGEIPISISGDPTDPRVLVHTTRAVGNVTRAMLKLKKGDLVGVRGPLGTSWPVEEAVGRDVVIVTGGIGLAPLRPAIYKILAERGRYGSVVLLYGARTPADLLFRKELERWRGKLHLEVDVTVDHATPDWFGKVGVVTTLIPRAPFDPHGAIAFVCGPEVMMRFTVFELENRGVSADRIHVSMERNMKCGLGLCGRCQCGPKFVCRDGPVFRFAEIRKIFETREV